MSAPETETVPTAPDFTHHGTIRHEHVWLGGDAGHNGSAAAPFSPVMPAGPSVHAPYYPTYREPIDWRWALYALAAIFIALAAVAAFVAGKWLLSHDFGGDTPKSAPVTIATVLHGKNFATDRHSVCSIERVAGGTAWRLALNRGAGCGQTVEAVFAAEKVQLARGEFRRLSATWVHNPRELKGDELARVNSLALGEQLKVDLRHIVVRVPHDSWRQLQAQAGN